MKKGGIMKQISVVILILIALNTVTHRAHAYDNANPYTQSKLDTKPLPSPVATYSRGHIRFHEDGTSDYLEGSLTRKEITSGARDCLRCRDCCCGWKDPRRPECEECRVCQIEYSFECPTRCDRDRNTDIDKDVLRFNQTCIQTCPPTTVTISCGNGNNFTTASTQTHNQSQSQGQNCTQDSRQLVANVSCEHTCNVEGIQCSTSCPDQCAACASPADCIACFNLCFNACAQTFEACLQLNCPVSTGEVVAISNPFSRFSPL